MEQLRAFIAVELPDRLKAELRQLQAKLKEGRPSAVKWVGPDGVHLTLKFLGNVAADRADEIAAAMEDAARGISPFRLEVVGLGVFPNSRRAQVAWVGLSGEVDKLAQLQQRIEANLAEIGFARESRPFKAHLTLARVRNGASPDERQRFGQLIADTEFETSCHIQVDAVSLMKSQLTPAGAIYNRVGLVRLNKS